MKVKIDDIQRADDFIHIRYSGIDTSLTGRIMLPIAGFDKAWIMPAIRHDLAQSQADQNMVDALAKEYLGQELDIAET